MATKKKMLQAAAGNAGGGAAALNVEDVFSTYLYTGTGSTPQTIVNNIDLGGEGGMVWFKPRWSYGHALFDTERGVENRLSTNNNFAEDFRDDSLTSFNSDGFTIGGPSGSGATDVNGTNSEGLASWTFRKAPKFFDVVTYTGTGSAQSISHNLGSVPGVVIVKDISGSGNSWTVYHRSAGNTGGLLLNDTNAFITSTTFFNDTTPTESQFTVGNATNTNASGRSFVAYLFAHNDGDGEFGPDGDADIIKCGGYAGTGSAGNEIDLGFEPQWLMIKNADGGDWVMFDTMRGLPSNDTGLQTLIANATTADVDFNTFLTGSAGVQVTPTGFSFRSGEATINGSWNYIYIAIRRGTKVPESGTEVFAMDTGDGSSNPAYYSGFPVDFAYTKDKSNSANWLVGSRLTQGQLLSFNTTSAESANSVMAFDYSDRWYDLSRASNYYSGMWKRAPNFFDVVAYTGNGTAGRTVSHNLGVAPEMMWVKNRDRAYDWFVYDKVNGATNYMLLNESQATTTSSTRFNDTEPTDTVFTVGSANQTNQSGDSIIAYLFASLDGVSKVGSYTGNGSSQTIDCGFTSGARFVLIKRTDSTGNWQVFDTERGIVSGNDPRLFLDDTSAELSTRDILDPASSGFSLTSDTSANTSGAEYIFYAIA